MKRLFKIQFLLTLLLSTMIFANIGGGIAHSIATSIEVNKDVTLLPQYGDTQKYAYYKFTVPNNTEATITYTAPSEEKVYFSLHDSTRQITKKLTAKGESSTVEPPTLSAGEYYFLIKKYGVSTQGIPLAISFDSADNDEGTPPVTENNLVISTKPWIANASGTTVINSDGSISMTRPDVSGYKFLFLRLSQTGRNAALSRDLIAGEKITVKIRAKSSSTESYIYSKFLDFPLTRFDKANEYQDFIFDTTVKSNISSYAWLGLFTNKAGDTVTVKSVEIVKEGSRPTEDTTPPLITLKGFNPLTLKVGDTYTEAGATATDAVDGDVSASIIIGGDTVDTNIAGTYTVTYNVSDEKGNKAVEVKRTVNITNVLVLHEATDVIHKTISEHTLSKNEVVTIENTIFKSIGTNDTTEAIRIAGDGTQTVKLKNLQFENEGIPIYITNVKKVVAEGINCLNVGGCIVMDEIEDVDIKYVQIKNWGIVKVKGWDLRESYTKEYGNLNAISVRSEQPGKYHYRNTKSFNLGHVLIDNSENNMGSIVTRSCDRSVKTDYISTAHLNAGKDGYGHIYDVYAIGNDTDTISSGLVPFDQNNKNITYENIYGFNVAAYCFGGWGGTHMTFKNSMCVTTKDHGKKLYPDQSQGSCDRGDANTAIGISLKIPNNKDTFDIRDLVFDHVLINTPAAYSGKFINKTMMYTLNMLDDRNVTFPNSNISFTTFPDSVYDDGNPPTANRYGLEEWGDTPKEEVTEDRILDIIKGKKGANNKRPSMFQTHGKSAGFLPVDW